MGGESLRPGVRAAYLVRRRLQLVPLGNASPQAPVAEWFDDLVGFNALRCDGARLTLAYDASRLHVDQLLARLREQQWIPAPGALNRFRLGWYRYTDANIVANANDTSSTACSQSPLRHR